MTEIKNGPNPELMSLENHETSHVAYGFFDNVGHHLPVTELARIRLVVGGIRELASLDREKGK